MGIVKFVRRLIERIKMWIRKLGYSTKFWRENLELKKSHINDALAMVATFHPPSLGVVLLQKQTRSGFSPIFEGQKIGWRYYLSSKVGQLKT